jgi:hypothetical protein
VPIDKDREDRFTWKAGEIKFIPPSENKQDQEDQEEDESK